MTGNRIQEYAEREGGSQREREGEMINYMKYMRKRETNRQRERKRG